MGSGLVTFTLPGFTAVRREGVELSANFTATINAELRVGALEETIIVSGYNLLNASPVLATNTRYGPTWLQPAQIMDARMAKFEVQVQF